MFLRWSQSVNSMIMFFALIVSDRLTGITNPYTLRKKKPILQSRRLTNVKIRIT